MKILDYYDLETIDYDAAYDLQLKILEKVQQGENDTLLLLEHPKVITIGLNAKEENLLFSENTLLQQGYDIRRIRRGGDVTYHGPGQIVGYTIVNLRNNYKGSIKQFVYNLEQLFIDFLKETFNIEAIRDPINAGVFIGNDKIVAIGLSVHKGVTMHGFAFNVNTLLDDFNAIVPCGLKERGVTSVQALTSQHQDICMIKSKLAQAFANINHYEICVK